MAALFTVYNDNHLYVPVVLKIPDPTDPREFLLYEPLLGADPHGFLSVGNDHLAVAAHASLSDDLIYSGVPGIWYFYLPATTLTFTLLNTYFASTEPWLIVTIPSASRQVAEGAFEEIRFAV